MISRSLEITSDLGTEDAPLSVTIDGTEIAIHTEGGRGRYVILTHAQWDLIRAEWHRFEAATATMNDVQEEALEILAVHPGPLDH